MQRLKWIDAAKAMVLFSVIFGHFGVDGVNRIVYPYQLIAFFLLSGYTMKEQPLDHIYLKKIFIRYMNPYFITVFLVTIGDIITTVVYLKDSTIQTISTLLRNDLIRGFAASGDIKRILTMDVDTQIGAIWFLPAMFFATVFAQLIIQKCYTGRYIISAFLMILAQSTAEQFWLPFSIQSAMIAVIFIVLGYDCNKNNLLDKIIFSQYIFAAAVFLLGIWFRYECHFVIAQMTDLGISSLVGLSGCVLLYFFSYRLQKNVFLQFIGKNCIVFLCVHFFELETMQRYFNMVYSFTMPIGVDWWNQVVFAVIELAVVLIISTTVVKFMQYIKQQKSQKVYFAQHTRMPEIDIEKSILIILMLIGHTAIDQGLRNIIYSFHMGAFIVLSGYFYKKKDILTQLKKDFWNTLFPCLVFIAGCNVINMIHTNSVVISWKNILLAMSFSAKVFVDAQSIGPVWFVFMLFCVKTIYLTINKMVAPQYINVVVGLTSVIGIILGNCGIWLPWSFDCALYSVGIYHVGYKIREYNIFEIVKERPYYYFGLSSVWAYAIFKGNMEIAARKYTPVTISFVGMLCGTLIGYMLSEYIKVSLIPMWMKKVLIQIGRSTIWILLVHAWLESKWLAVFLKNFFSCESVYYMIAVILLDVLIGGIFSNL